MFVITLNKRKMSKAAAVAASIVIIGVVGFGVKNFFSKDEAAAGVKNQKFTTTQQMVSYIEEKGYSVDIQTAKVAEVEIPKKFDDNFVLFNEKIMQTDGLSLEKYKGDKVNKWTFDIIDYMGGEKEGCAVLLIKKEKLIGAYVLEKPEGIAKPLANSAAENTSAQTEQTQDTSAQTEQTQDTSAQAQTTGEIEGPTE